MAITVVGGGVAVSSAQAAGEVMTVAMTSDVTTIQSGAQLVYRVSYECSSLATDPCANAVLTLPAPTGKAPNGSAAPSVSSGAVVGNVQIASTTGSNPIVVKMNPIAPGTTGEIQVSWTVPNLTTLPNTVYSAAASLSYQNPDDPAGAPRTLAVSGADVTTTATPSMTAVKQIVTPSSEAVVEPDENVTYRVYACNPGVTALGGLNFAGLKLVDTLPIGAVYVSATGPATYSADTNTVTWDVANPVNNKCGSPTESFQVTVVYPSASFVPAPAAPQLENHFVNQLDVFATGIDGTPVSGHAEVKHAFIGPIPGGGNGGDIKTTHSHNNVGPSSVNVGDLETLFGWGGNNSWGQNSRPWIDTARLKTNVAWYRIPCLADGVASAPAGPDSLGAYNEPMTVPANQCTNLPFDTRYLAVKNTAELVKIEIATWDGTSSNVRTWTPTSKPYPAKLYIHASDAGSNPSMGVPENEIVTDIRVSSKDVVINGRTDSVSMPWLDYYGVETQAFADSGLASMRASYRYKYSNTEYAPGETPTTDSLGALGGGDALRNFAVPHADPVVTKSGSPNPASLKLGDTVTWNLEIRNGVNGTIPLHPQLIDVLPSGLELDPSSITWSKLAGVGGAQPQLTQGTKTIDGVDHVTLTWSWPSDVVLTRDATEWPKVTFKTKVTVQAQEGAHSGSDAQIAVLKDSVRPLPDATAGQPSDKWDLNGDGNTAEYVAQASVAWTVLNTSGATIEKFVKGELDVDWTKNGVTNPQTASTEGLIDYRIAITNQNATSLSDLVAYDLLPVIGDEAIGSTLAGQPRGTAWNPKFVETSSVPAGMIVQYSTSSNPCRPELFGALAGASLPPGCTNDWTGTAPTDPASVKALRLVMAGVYARAGSTVDFTYRMQAPLLTSVTDQPVVAPQLKANNNVAWSTSRVLASGGVELLPPAEAPIVTVRDAAGFIGDFVWNDVNKNGIQDADETGVSGVVVNLLDTNGDPVLGTDGLPISTTTDANGAYKFLVPLGDYRIEFEAPSGRDFSGTHASGSTSENDSDAVVDADKSSIDHQIGISDVVSIKDPVITGDSTSNINRAIDAGLVAPGISVVKDDHKSVVLPGESSTYDVTITNLSATAQAVDVVATDTLPTNSTFTSASDGGAEADGVVTWNLGTLAAGEVRVVRVSITVSADALGNDAVTNVANVTSQGVCTDDPATVVNECESTDTDRVPAISVVKTDNRESVQAGDQLVYELTATNSSSFEAPAVTVTDTLPANVTFVSADNGGVHDAGVVTWDLGVIEANSTKVVTVAVTVNGDVVLGDQIRNGAAIGSEGKCWDNPATPVDECSSVDIDNVPSVKIFKTDNQDVVKVGQELTYQLTASNTSRFDAPNVTIKDPLPAELELLSSVPMASISDDGPNVLEWNIGTLAAGQSSTVTVTLRVRDVPPSTRIINTAVVDSDGVCIDDPATSEDDCSSTDIDTTPAKVWILKDDHVSEIAAGDSLVYDLTVGNDSTTDTAIDVVVTDTLPSNATFVSATDGGQLSADGTSVVWNLADLSPGARHTVRVTVVVGILSAGESVENTATVTTPNGCASKEDCTTVDVDLAPNLKVVKTNHVDYLNVGQDTTYEITATNDGKGVAHDVIVRDALPEGLMFVAATNGGRLDNGVVTWKVGDLVPGESVVVKITATVGTTVGSSVSNTASITGPKSCLDRKSCSSTDTDVTGEGDGSGVPLASEVPGFDAGTLPSTGFSSTLAIWLGVAGLVGGAFLLIGRRRQTEPQD